MAEPLDLDRILREHGWPTPDEDGDECCEKCGNLWPCLPYRLASELAEARAALQRVQKKTCDRIDCDHKFCGKV